MRRACQRHHGFSFVELLVVLAIVALLAAMAAPLGELHVKRQKEQELRHALREVRNAIDAYKRDADSGRIQKPVGSSGYPASLQVLIDGVTDQQSSWGVKIYYLRRVPKDPMVVASPQGQSVWGLRSYQSPANDPKAGVDIFDVYSLSQGVALDGSAYRDW